MKKVWFNEKMNEVHTIIAWDYAYRKSRDNFYERLAWDRAHFQRKIQLIAPVLNKVLDKEHRKRIYCERFIFH